MKDRSGKQRSYDGELMQIGGPGEAYIKKYLEREYERVIPVGKRKKRWDYECYPKGGGMHLNEGKTDTRIADTLRIPWEAFRLEDGGSRGYTSWGYAGRAHRVIYFVPQWLKILDVRSADVRRLIFRHVMAGGHLPIVPTLTDKDRITFLFGVPIALLKEADLLKETEIAEIPLGLEIPYQMPMGQSRSA